MFRPQNGAGIVIEIAHTVWAQTYDSPRYLLLNLGLSQVFAKSKKKKVEDTQVDASSYSYITGSFEEGLLQNSFP